MQVIVTKCNVPTYWYADKIGETFTVIAERSDWPYGERYHVDYRGTDHYYIGKDDCVPVKDASKNDVADAETTTEHNISLAGRKIRITGVSDHPKWYEKYIGRIFTIEKQVSTWAHRPVTGYEISDGLFTGFGKGRFVDARDCVLVPLERLVDPREFRLLNTNEKAVILAAAKKGRIPATHDLVQYVDRVQVSYEPMQGGFTICLLLLRRTFFEGRSAMHIIWRGASRRSYKDTRNPIKGRMLAFSRAVLYSRGVELS